MSGAVAVACAAVGAAVVVGAAGYAAYKAFPPVMKGPQDLVGKTVPFDILANVWPPIRTLAIIGTTQAGKTTLRQRLAFDRSTTERTQNITAYVVSMQTEVVPVSETGG